MRRGQNGGFSDPDKGPNTAMAAAGLSKLTMCTNIFDSAGVQAPGGSRLK